MNEAFLQAGAQILVILGDSPGLALRYAHILKSPFPILSDPDRSLYARYELSKVFIGLQRTASVIIDPNGILRYLKRSTDPNKWLFESRALLHAVQDLDIQLKGPP
jgi:peroxiredoxin